MTAHLPISTRTPPATPFLFPSRILILSSTNPSFPFRILPNSNHNLNPKSKISPKSSSLPPDFLSLFLSPSGSHLIDAHMSPGGGRCPRRAGCARRRHGVGAKIDADGGGVERRRGRSRLRVDAEGNMYVLDSEDEDSDTEHGVRMAAKAATIRNRTGSYDLSVAEAAMFEADADRTAVKDQPPEGPPLVGGDGAAADDLVPKGHPLVPTDKFEDGDLAPEVAACLKEVLANIDPLYHDVFVSMYKKIQC